jgi:hypothetical protein
MYSVVKNQQHSEVFLSSKAPEEDPNSGLKHLVQINCEKNIGASVLGGCVYKINNP